MSEKALEALIERFRQDAGRVRTWHAQGCDKCAGTGYRGRIAVIELLRVTPAIRELLCKDSGYSELANVLRNERFRTFAEDGLRHVLEGDLSLEQWRSVSDRYPRTLIHARSMPDSTCPLCASRLAAHVPRPESDREDFDCPNCGRYSLARSLLGTFTWEARRAATLSHAIQRMQRPAGRPFITSSLAKAIEAEGRLANASEQLDNLVLHLGSVLVEPGDTRSLRAPDMRAILGSVTENAAAWTLKQAHGSGLIQGIETKGGSYQLLDATLSVAGWERNRELLAGGSRSRRAFMASRWGDAEFDRVFEDCFKPAVERAGFDLIRMDEEPKAGLIDDHMRLEIRRSRFLIADLSHMNPGAYWEAGYAEGLRAPRDLHVPDRHILESGEPAALRYEPSPDNRLGSRRPHDRRQAAGDDGSSDPSLGGEAD